MRTILLVGTLALTGCLSPGGGSPQAKVAFDPAPIGGDPTPELEPAPGVEETPDSPIVISWNQIQGKTYSMNNGSIRFTGTQVIDTRCGATYNVIAQSEANGVLTASVSLVASSYVHPGHTDCLVDTTNFGYKYYQAGTCKSGILNAQDIAWKITYTIESVNGGLAITRALTGKEWVRSCSNPALIGETDSMPEEMYYE